MASKATRAMAQIARIDGDAGVAAARAAHGRGRCLLIAAQPLPGLRLLQGNGSPTAKIGAARALQQIAADRRHVAELLRGRPPERLRERGIVRHDLRIGRHVAHSRERAEDQLAAPAGVDAVQLLKAGDIDEAAPASRH